MQKTAGVSVVTYEVLSEHVAIITLDRPEVRNAINGAVASELERLLERSEADENVRAVVLASSHATVFCAGADLAEIAGGNSAALSTARGGFAGLTRARRSKPWIAAVDGAAFAGGFEIALACDMIVASAASRFGLPEVKRGLFAAAAGPLRLLRVLPRNIALELIATGDGLGGERAYALGLINRLCAPGEVLADAISLARSIAGNAPLAVRASLALARVATAISEEEYWKRSEATRMEVFGSADAQEGARAFIEKRVPVWVGR